MITVNDDRLTWPVRELIHQLGEKLYVTSSKQATPTQINTKKVKS